MDRGTICSNLCVFLILPLSRSNTSLRTIQTEIGGVIHNRHGCFSGGKLK